MSIKLTTGLHMKKGDYIAALLRSEKTVFSSKELALIWRESVSDAAKTRISYYVKTGKLIRVRKGIYAKDPNYDPLELATKIFTPSYISFETVLARAGVIFQHYQQIFVASYLTRKIDCDPHTYSIRKIKGIVLTNGFGIINNDRYSIATAERAFLDLMYINADYYFDNTAPLNWEQIMEWAPYYKNKRMEQRINNYYKMSKYHVD